ncbi:hypothetical protein HS088_TW06G00542 [Tripterygium wilfordii]|uniref:Integral membrane family protein n=1 Tax=Tripterygium wilfordii TaxID=458696 RepID=A0A7J7DJ52_TRIWF|nr:hypothetical protein HS088_TW06G00542 [Tripterygium wilfordii]
MASCLSSTVIFSLPKLAASSSPSKLPSLAKVSAKKIGSIRCKALGETSQGSFDRTVYQGVYGPWTVDQTDVREVILYRSGLVTAASSLVVAGLTAYLPNDILLSEIIRKNLDIFYLLGAGGLGLSLYLIHIYVTEIKQTLQALWALGIVGSLATYAILARPAGESLVQYVIDNPTTVWFIGPLFAALTGLVFKEGLCYGKLEAGVLTFIIPIILLGHLVGSLQLLFIVSFTGYLIEVWSRICHSHCRKCVLACICIHSYLAFPPCHLFLVRWCNWFDKSELTDFHNASHQMMNFLILLQILGYVCV